MLATHPTSISGLHHSGSGTQALAFEAFGVRVRVVVSDSEELERIWGLLPPGSQRCTPERLETTFALHKGADSTYEISREGDVLAGELQLDAALEELERALRVHVAREAHTHVFVHAGVVGHSGGAILLPGSSFTGKTSLVAALVRAGAEYYSDEYAPLDPAGLVHPFAKPLSIRDERSVQVDHHVDSLGGVAGDEPLPVGAIVVTTYESGAGWRPRRLSSGEAVLALLAHTVPARSRPAQSLETISRAVEGATVIDGTRGEADAVAPLLLSELGRAR